MLHSLHTVIYPILFSTNERQFSYISERQGSPILDANVIAWQEILKTAHEANHGAGGNIKILLMQPQPLYTTIHYTTYFN